MNKSASPTNSNTSLGSTSFVLLLVIALLNTIGLTIIIPLVPFLTLQYLAHSTNLAAIVGWLTAAYGLCQLIAAPGLGVLSDRFGRRPILFICLLGSAFGYLIFGLGGALWLLFLGRIIDGLTGGDISRRQSALLRAAEPTLQHCILTQRPSLNTPLSCRVVAPLKACIMKVRRPHRSPSHLHNF